jgi:peptide-methionine (S)-S-oxide reductase
MRVVTRFCGFALVAVMVMACQSTTTSEEDTFTTLPSPKLDVSVAAGGALQTAVVAGGCFWGVEAVFEHLKGVEEVVSGYSGGTAATAHYAMVTSGTTGHAESVRIVFRPSEITYGQILRVFFSIAHDPTQIDQQYPDSGPQYRSDIFYGNEEQRKVAAAYIAQLDATKLLPKRIATRVDPLDVFYPAEQEQQGYLARHLGDDYIVTFDLPRLAALQRHFPELYRAP